MTALSLAGPMVAGLEVDIAAMRRNLTERGTTMGSERLLAGLAARVGKQSAQAALQRLLHDDTGAMRSLSRSRRWSPRSPRCPGRPRPRSRAG